MVNVEPGLHQGVILITGLVSTIEVILDGIDIIQSCCHEFQLEMMLLIIIWENFSLVRLEILNVSLREGGDEALCHGKPCTLKGAGSGNRDFSGLTRTRATG